MTEKTCGNCGGAGYTIGRVGQDTYEQVQCQSCFGIEAKPIPQPEEKKDIAKDPDGNWQELSLSGGFKPEEKKEVCVWTKTNNKFVPSCTNFYRPEFSEHGPEEHGYVFCPYCSRKIEVKDGQ
jgi:hypothetical protein